MPDPGYVSPSKTLKGNLIVQKSFNFGVGSNITTIL